MLRTLYHYVHCPFCVRVRMTLGYLDLEYHSKVLPYNDEATPISLTGTKMLPILVDNAKVMNESLDIMTFLDQDQKLKIKEVTSSADFNEFEAYLNLLGNPVHSLAMPYWVWSPEFNDESRKYFQTKKEEKRGPFNELAKHKKKFLDILENEWPKLEADLHPFYKSQSFGLKDILLAAHIWGLYVVPEFQFTPKIHDYLQRVKVQCKFNYHEDFWR